MARIKHLVWIASALAMSLAAGHLLAAGPGYGAVQEQVAVGRAAYQKRCVACHGVELKGGAGPALGAGAPLDVVAGTASAADLARWIRLNMPPDDPGSVGTAESVNVTAFLLASRGAKLPAPITTANAASILVKAKR